jgi:hypothetical protein
MKHLPWQTFSQLSHVYGGVLGLQLGSMPAIIISDPEIVKEALITKADTFSSRRLLRRVKYGLCQGNDIVHHIYDDRWKLLRKLVHQFMLSKRMITERQHIIKEEANYLTRTVLNKYTKGEEVWSTTNEIVLESPIQSQ